MSNQIVDVLPESKQGDNIFDDYYALIEKHKSIRGNEGLYDAISIGIGLIEQNVQDLYLCDEKDKDKADRLDSMAKKILTSWYEIFVYFKENDVFLDALAYNFYGLSLVFRDLSEAPVRNIDELSAFFSPSIDYDLLDKRKAYDVHEKSRSASRLLYEKSHEMLTSVSYFLSYDIGDDAFDSLKQINFKIIHRLEKTCYGIAFTELKTKGIEQLKKEALNVDLRQFIFDYSLKLHDTAEVSWMMKVTIHENNPDAEKFLSLLHTITMALNAVSDDVKVEIEDWGNGSKWAKFKIKIGSFFSREDVKETLNKAVDAARAQYMDIPIAEADKTKAEAEMVKKTTQSMMDVEQAVRSNKLDLDMKELSMIEKTVDIESKMIDNQLKKLAMRKTLSEMIRDGLIESDSKITIEVNNLLVYEHPPTAKILVNYDKLANSESVQPKTSDNEPEIPEPGTT